MACNIPATSRLAKDSRKPTKCELWHVCRGEKPVDLYWRRHGHNSDKTPVQAYLHFAMQLRINIPPLTRLLLGLLLAISITHQVTRYIYGGLDPELLALIPQWSLFYPWVYFTATFAEQNVVTLLVAGATILYGGKYLERAWGSTEFGKFVLVVTVLPNFAATLIYVLWFAITRDDTRAYVSPPPSLGPDLLC